MSRPVGLVVGAVCRHRIRHHGLVIDCRSPLITPDVEAALAFRLYEEAEVRFIREHCRAVRCAVDLGASIGVTGAHLLDVMASTGRLKLVEANPALIPLLEDRFKGSCAEVIHAAIAYGSQVASLHVGQRTMGSRLAHDGESAVQVPARTLSSIVEDFDYPFTLVADIEGAEVGFLWDDAAALDRCDTIIVEVDYGQREGRRIGVREQLHRYGDLGFRIVATNGDVVVMRR